MFKIKYALLLILFISSITFAQEISDYNFIPSSGTYTPLTGATNPTLSGGTLDDGYYNALPIGFTFNFNDNSYTTVSVTTNGVMFLGGPTLTSSYLSNNLTSNAIRPCIAPLWDDLELAAATDMNYKTEGSPGNQIFTVQWSNVYWTYSATTVSISFQAKLYEANGQIRFVYQQESGTTAGSLSASIGIAGVNTGAGNFLSLDGTGPSPSASSTIETTTLSTRPATGQIYDFIPPVPATNDVGVKQIITPGAMALINTSTIPIANIKNYGTATQTNFEVICSIVGQTGTLRYFDRDTVASLSGGDTTRVNFLNWTPTVAETCNVIMRTTMTDENALNDRKTKSCEASSKIIIGTGTSTTSGMPIYRYYPYSVSKMIYLQREMTAGTIYSLAYYKGSGTNLTAADSVRIYMRHTTDTLLVTGDWDTLSMTRVYFGQYPNNAETGWMEVTLQTPFAYNGTDNLEILFLSGRYTAVTSGYPYWQYTSTYPYYRAGYNYSSTSMPTTISYTSSSRPNVRFDFAPPPANDVGVMSILTPGASHYYANPIQPSARIKNYGTGDQTGFNVICSIVNSAKATLYTNTQNISLAAGRDTVVNFGSYTHSTLEQLTVIVRTALGGDENPANDRKTTTTDVNNRLTIGNGTASTYVIPINRFYNYSAYEAIYLQSEINAMGNIIKLSFDKSTAIDTPVNFVRIYLKHTSATTLASGAWDSLGAGYTRVYSGPFPNTGTGWMEVTLTTPFFYNNAENLGVLVVKDSEPYISSTYAPNYRYTVMPTYMARNAYSDASMPTSLTQNYNRSNLGLVLAPPPANDIGVSSIIAPTATQAINFPIIPKAIVGNYGTATQFNFKVYCQITGPGKVLRYLDSVEVASLASFQSDTARFSSWTPVDVELDSVKIWTALAGDENTGNDLQSRTTNVFVMTDVGISGITRPYASKESEHTRIPFSPQVTVSNYGSYDELDVPVIAEIYSISPLGSDGPVEAPKSLPASQKFTINPSNTDVITNMTTHVKEYGTRSIDYSVLWAIPLEGYSLCLGVTPVCVGDYPAGETLMWVSHSGTSSATTSDNGVLIYNLNTRTLVDQFTQPDVGSGWGWRDMCFYNGYVYAGYEGAFVKVDPVTHAVVGTYTVTGAPSPMRAMTDDMTDSLYTANWGSNIFKFSPVGGTPRQITQTRQIYGLAYDAGHNCVWGSTQDNASDLVKYSYPDFTPIDSTGIPELGSGIAGGCEMWGNKLLYLGQMAVDSVICISGPLNLVYRDSVSVSVNYGKASVPATFKPCTLMTEGNYWFTTYTKLPGDMVSVNNTMNRDFSTTTPVLTLSSPANDAYLSDNTPTFIWNPIEGAVDLYRIEVDTNATFPDPIFGGELSETEIESDELADGTYYWRVRVQSPGTPDPWSEVRVFHIQTAPPGWTQKENISDVVNVIKDGGALVGVIGTDKSGPTLYALLGSKTPQFKKYVVGSGLGWEYNEVDTILFGYKFKPTTGVDTTKFNKKYPGKGAAMCFDDDHTIYAVKGNGTYEFWAYDLTSDAGWTPKAFVPTVKGLKGGSSIRWCNGKVYLLAGGQKVTDPYFFAYDPLTDAWTTLTGPTQTDGKPYKDGSSIAVLGGKIYAIHGGAKSNAFYLYDADGNSWSPMAAMPIEDSSYHKYKKKLLVKDGATTASGNGVIYATKGGATEVFWKYTPVEGDTGYWERLERMPIEKENKKHAPKTGAAMAFLTGKVWLLTGQKNPDFWVYNPNTEGLARPVNTTTTTTSVMTNNTMTTHSFNFEVNPNPFSKLTTIRYTVPISGNVSIKLYNASGRLVETLVNDNLSAGTYSMNLAANKLASGIYFVKYNDNTNKSEIKLIVQ